MNEANPPRTNPSGFRNPYSRRNRAARLLWNIVYALLFRPSPWFMGAWRSWLLRLFGAKIGWARFSSSSKIWAPWLLEVGRDVYVDMGVNLYNSFGIRIGDRVVISQGTFLCSATHDYRDPIYALTGAPITVGNDCWIAAEAFIAPGVRINDGVVVGARAVVLKEVPQWTVVAGHPARVLRPRTLNEKPNPQVS